MSEFQRQGINQRWQTQSEDTRRFTKLKLSDTSCTMSGSNQSDYLTAPAADEISEHATITASLLVSARSGSMAERMESEKLNSIEEQIEQSKCHWSQLTEMDSDCDEVAEISNVEVFKTLQVHSTWGSFFKTFNARGAWGELAVGEKFAEGGQAELYEAQVHWYSQGMRDDMQENAYEYVLKVFKKGTFLRHLQSQWPHGMLLNHAERAKNFRLGKPQARRYLCDVLCGTLLKDGRFAFLMTREHEDLRSCIDRNMWRVGKEHGPFSKDFAEAIMYEVAQGMDCLHSRSIVHRDLKASNVLIRRSINAKVRTCFIADFECSGGVVGTGFFRAPEILQACKDRSVHSRSELFTKAADVYSYGMTCYEILTGRLPFEGHSMRDYDLVLNGHCPEVPEYVDDWMRKLLMRCWHPNPGARPSFGDILNILVSNSVIGLALRFWGYRREFREIGGSCFSCGRDCVYESDPTTTGS